MTRPEFVHFGWTPWEPCDRQDWNTTCGTAASALGAPFAAPLYADSRIRQNKTMLGFTHGLARGGFAVAGSYR